jgi:hypothetical protein
MATLALSACHGGRTAPAAEPEPAGSGAGTQTAVVLDGSRLRAGETLLTALVGRLANFEVLRSGRTCPLVHLRGRQTILGDDGPAIYVDGARAVNTCVLDEIAPGEVSRVEIYPMGVRSGFASDRNGLILVFLRDGRDGAG